jgi:DNA-directed RNA polymerase specialized sigma24 family protein
MTHQEIAQALELPLGTVKSDLVRGHEALKQYVTMRTRPL